MDFLISVNVKINHPIAEARNQKIVFDSSFFLATGHPVSQQALFQPLSSLSWREVPQLSSCLQALTLKSTSTQATREICLNPNYDRVPLLFKVLP